MGFLAVISMRKVLVIALLLVLATFVAELTIPASAMDVSNAVGVHYEFDKGAYNPGDSGRLLLVIDNEEDEAVNIYGANLNITGIGVFGTHGLNLTCPVWSTAVYPGGHACLLLRGTPLDVTIVFKIPVDTQSREYAYTWSVEEGRGVGGSVLWPTGSGALWVVRPGETPTPMERSQADQLNSNLQVLALIGVPLLAIAYPLVKWKSKLAARFIIAGIAIVMVLSKDSLGPFILVPLAVLAFLAVIYKITGWLFRRRKPQPPAGVTELTMGAKKIRRSAKWIAILSLLAAISFIAAACYAAAPTGAMISPVPNTPLYEYLTTIWAWYDGCIFTIVAALSVYYIAGGVKTQKRRSRAELTRKREEFKMLTPPLEPTQSWLTTRRKGVLMIVSAPLVFVLSGLFLANTVVNPIESLTYQVGEVLCFILAPVMLIVGITIFIIARRK